MRSVLSAIRAGRCGLARVVVLTMILTVPAPALQAQTDPAPTLAAGTDAAAPTFAPLPPPSLNFYGSSGGIDMPSALMLPDGQYATTLSYFGGQSRFTLTFQATPWMSASFRYNAIQNWNLGGFSTYYDRGFDVRFRLLRERRRWPEITLGLQDFVGTGIYAAEYLVATKRFELPRAGTLKVTGGLGWGRLGSYGSIGSTGGARPSFDVNSTGGEVSYEQWFRGPVSPFAGLEWTPSDRLGLKLEYSTDAYVVETTETSVFERKSPINFGIEYQASPRTRLGAYYLYGSELGLSAQIQLNPTQPVTPLAIPAPRTILPRPTRAQAPEFWATGWAVSQSAPTTLRDRIEPILRADGLVLESLDVSADQVELRFRNLRYKSMATAVGRAARALAETMPGSVETFRLVPMSGGMALSAVTLRRSDLEALAFDGMATQALAAVTAFSDAPPQAETAVQAADLYPDTSWSLAPYFSPSYFDPARPFRIDVGLALRGSYAPAPGWIVSGTLRQRLAGNVADGAQSASELPPVRTDQVLYAQTDTTLNQLFVARQWRPGRDLYARVTAGYLESMYGGVSTELLWKPVNSPIGLGIEANYVRKRDFDQRLGFQDYSVFTGHASAYAELGGGFVGQLDMGRYLAGDIGATFGLDRVFNNGWSVGGFFTLTNVSAEEFGEGSFDKGIRFSIPLEWMLGKPSRQNLGTTIRPIQRDGGQRVSVPGRLYNQVRGADRKALRSQWSRVWE